MKIMNKLFIPFLFLILTFSCKSSNDPEVVYADWNLKNKQYFNQMKDSTDYVLYQIPASRGGGSFYYKTLKNGNQPIDSLSDYTVVNIVCRAQLINGVIFANTFQGNSILSADTTNSYNQQVAFFVKGFTENLRQMKVGEVRKFVLPQELSYKDLRDDKVIPPYSVTIWEIKLNAYFN